MAILITGGAGYIGSHTCIELLNNNYKIIVVDNLSNSSIESLNRVKEITGKQFEFYKESVLNREKMNEIFWKIILKRLYISLDLKQWGIYYNSTYVLL